MTTTHQLKTWPIYWDAVKDGRKTFEVRKNDRDYKVGDVLQLFRWEPDFPEGTDLKAQPHITADVTYVLPGMKDFGVGPDFVILGLDPRETPDLSPDEIERYAMLAEEAGEIVQCCTKILRHGTGSHNPDRPGMSNIQHLEKELGDLKGVVDLMINREDVNVTNIEHHARYKIRRARPYLHHQDLSDYED